MTLEKLPCNGVGGNGDGRRRMLGLAIGVPMGVAAVLARSS
jgi:hypothetical protein